MNGVAKSIYDSLVLRHINKRTSPQHLFVINTRKTHCFPCHSFARGKINKIRLFCFVNNGLSLCPNKSWRRLAPEKFSCMVKLRGI